MIIRRETLQAALAATTADDTRYFLHAVQAEPSRNRVVSTNGHVLLIATDNEPIADEDFPQVPGAEFHGNPAGDVLIDADVCRSIIATMPKKSTIPVLTTAQLGRNGSETTATLVATDLQAPRIAVLKDEGNRFPNYERIFKNEETVTMILAVDVLEQLIKAAKAVAPTGKRAKTPTITFNVPKSKATVETAIGIVTKGEYVTVSGLAMPCRP